MLITKGTDWCGEVARVFCALAKMAEIPTRIFYAYSDKDGHVINESYVNDRWILIDSTNGFLYKNENGTFLSAEDYVLNFDSFNNALSSYSDYYNSNIDYFKHIAVSEYILANAK